jgi:hypothetical protein
MQLLSYSVDNGCDLEFILAMVGRAIRLSLMLKDCEIKEKPQSEAIEQIMKLKKSDGKIVYNSYEISKTCDQPSSFFNKFTFYELCLCLKNTYVSTLNIRNTNKKRDKQKEMSMLIFSLCYPKEISIEFNRIKS